MTRSIVLVAALLAAGCASGGGGEADGTTGGAVWVPGAWVLEGRVPRERSGQTEVLQLTAELQIEADGTLTLSSPEGLCRDPNLAQQVTDAQRQQSTFICGDVRYELRPGTTPRGDISALVEDEVTVTECIRYELRDGVQVCVQTQTRIDIRRTVKRGRLTFLRRPSS